MGPMGDILYHRRFWLISVVKSTCCIPSKGRKPASQDLLPLSLWRHLQGKARSLEVKLLTEAQGLSERAASCPSCGLFHKQRRAL